MATSIFYGGFEITAEAFSVSVTRGRSRNTDEFSPSTGEVRLRNYNRNFDPSFFTTPTYLLMESGDFLLLENGDKIVLEQGSEASGDYGTIELGKDLEIRDGAVTVFTGHVEDTNNQYDRNKRSEAVFYLGDVFTSMASSQITTDWETVDGQLSGARLDALLGRSDLDLVGYIGVTDAGTIPLQGDTVPAGTNVLQYAQTIARTEWGRLYVAADGDIEFRGRYDFPSTTPAADFDDTNTNFAFNGVGVGVGSELRAWRATVTRVGGEPMTATASTPPPDRFGPRGVAYSGLLFRGDMFSESLAEHIAEVYSDTEAVISALTVFLHGLSTSDRATIAALDIGDAVTLSWTPTGSGSIITQTLVIEGVGYDADETGYAAMTFQLSAFPDTNYFTLDTDTLDGGTPLGF